MKTKTKGPIVIKREHREMLGFVRLLSNYGCAGEPACEPVSEDVATGKRYGGLCAVCEAANWLREHGYEATGQEPT